MKKINILKKIALAAAPVASAALIPLSLSSCGKSNNTPTPVVSTDSDLNFSSPSTFKIENPSSEGFFIVRINDRVYNLNEKSDKFSILENTSSKLKILPLRHDAHLTNNITKYTVEYTDGKKIKFGTTWFLNSSTDFTLKIKGDITHFQKFAPTLTIEAISNSGQAAQDIEWNYELSAAKSSSFIEYFDLEEKDNITTLTLIKDEIPQGAYINVSATNSTGSVVAKLEILQYIPLVAEAICDVDTITETTVGSVSLSMKAGTYISQGIEAGWNLFTSSGTPLNVCKQDYYLKEYSETVPVFKKGEQVPLTSTTFNIWATSWLNNYYDSSKSIDIYGKNTLEFLFADNLILPSTRAEAKFNNKCGIFSGEQTIKDEVLSMKLVNNFYIPELSGVMVQAILYSPGQAQVLARTDLTKVSFVSAGTRLTVDNSAKNDLYFPQYEFDKSQSKFVEATAPSDTATVRMYYLPFGDSTKYKMEFDSDPYIGFQDKIYMISGSDENWSEEKKNFYKKSGQDVGKWLFGDPNSTDDTVSKPVLSEPSGGDNYWKLTVPMVHQLYIPVNDGSTQIDSTRSVNIGFKINVKEIKSGTILASFPIYFTVLNGNRVINCSLEKYLADRSSYPYSIDLAKIADDLDTVYKEKGEDQYKSELYFPTTVKTADGETVEIKSIIKSESINGRPFFTSSIKHVSFQANSNIEEFVNVSTSSEHSEFTLTGTFSQMDGLETFTLDCCTKLKTIGKSAFETSGKRLSTVRLEDITIPSSVTLIDSYAFADTPFNRINILVEEGQTSPTLEIGEYAFLDDEYLTEVTNTSAIKILKWGAFCNCWNLSYFDFSDIEEIHSYAFKECYSLTSLNFSDNGNSIFVNDDEEDDVYFFSAENSPNKVNLAFLLGSNSNIYWTKSKTNKVGVFSSSGIRIYNNTNTTEEKNISISYCSLHNDAFSEIENLEISALNIIGFSNKTDPTKIFKIDPDKNLNGSLKTLEFTNSTLLASDQSWDGARSLKNGAIAGGSNLKYLIFNNSVLDSHMSNFFCEGEYGLDPKEQIKNIISFTYIAPEIGSTTVSAYIDKIKDNFFPNWTTAGILMFSAIPQTDVLNINIKMSYALYNEITAFQKVFERIHNVDDELGIQYAELNDDGSFSKFVPRNTGRYSDLNTVISWIPYD